MTRQTTAHGQQPLLATVRALYVEAGVGRFYTGVSAYLGLAWKPALQQAIFERARRHWLRRGEGGGGGGESGEGRALPAGGGGGSGSAARTDLTFWEAFSLGAAARLVSTTVCYPFLRANILGSSGQLVAVGRGGVVGALVALAREGGLGSLWQGLFPELVSACAASSDMLCCPTKLSPGPPVRAPLPAPVHQACVPSEQKI